VGLTLGSPESWGNNNNIIKNPRSSITTRRIDKAQMTNYLNDLIDGSGDRSAEQIKIYTRGVNPCVSVSYSGNNVGINGNNLTSVIPNASAKLPYRIMIDGAFQAPILSARDLLPISKMNRIYNSTISNASMVDYSKTKQVASNYTVVKDLLKVFDVKPNKSAKIEKPILENFKMNEAILDKHINISADSGMRTMDISDYTRTHLDTDMGATRDTTIEAWADTTRTQNRTQDLSDIEGNLQKGRYIQGVIQYKNSSGYNPVIRKNGEIGEAKVTRNLPEYNYTTPISDSRIHVRKDYDKEVHRDRKIPNAFIPAERNSYTVQKIEDSIRRGEYKSNHITLNKGGFQNEGVVPKFERDSGDYSTRNSEKARTNKFVLDQQLSRF